MVKLSVSTHQIMDSTSDFALFQESLTVSLTEMKVTGCIPPRHAGQATAAATATEDTAAKLTLTV